MKNTAFSPNYNCTIYSWTDWVSERPLSTAAGVGIRHRTADHISSQSFERDVSLQPAAFIYRKFQDVEITGLRDTRRGRAASLTVSTIVHLSRYFKAPVCQVEKRLDETRHGRVKGNI